MVDDIAEMSTEERILHVAAKVFTQKGYDATKTRDIAEAAGINVASLHYYYRSKDRLFELVATKALRHFSAIMHKVFLDEIMPFHEKIHFFVEQYTDFFKANPYLPMFIVTESEKNPDKIGEITRYGEKNEVMERQLNELVEQGVVRPISFANFIQSLVGLTVFPFLSKRLMMREVAHLDEQGYEQLLEERKALVPQILINYLYLKPPQ